MKKYYYILVFLLLPFYVQAQEPDPNLFQTWYLSYVLSSDGSDGYTVSEINPPITPYLTIHEDETFTGEGACNTFSGAFNFQEPDNYDTLNFTSTTETCGITLHNTFEGHYFSFFQVNGWYTIEEDGTGMKLTMYNAVFGFATFQNYPLSTVTHQAPTIRIYPIPTKETLYISSPQQPILRASYYNYSGQLLGSQTGPVAALDVSQLATGVYLLQLETEEGTSVHKFVKN